MGRYTIRTYVEAPRAACFEDWLYTTCQDLSLDLRVTGKVTTGLIFKNDKIFFEITSDNLESMKTFRRAFISAMTQYESAITSISGYGVNVSGIKN